VNQKHKNYWFGHGIIGQYAPIKWQGWLAYFIFIALIAVTQYTSITYSLSTSFKTTLYLMFTVVFIITAKLKSEPRLKSTDTQPVAQPAVAQPQPAVLVSPDTPRLSKADRGFYLFLRLSLIPVFMICVSALGVSLFSGHNEHAVKISSGSLYAVRTNDGKI